MDDRQIVIDIPESMSAEGRTAFLRAVTVIVAAFGRATIPTADDLAHALRDQLPKPDKMTPPAPFCESHPAERPDIPDRPES
jgi:hypothetical protein